MGSNPTSSASMTPALIFYASLPSPIKFNDWNGLFQLIEIDYYLRVMANLYSGEIDQVNRWIRLGGALGRDGPW